MKDQIDKDNLPKHIAVIMDGNGRWAKKKGAARVFGHKNAIKAVRETTEGCAELGVECLTLYAFSTENWIRPQNEIDALMELLVATVQSEMKTLTDNNVKLETIGNIEKLPQHCQSELKKAKENTENNTGLKLILALNYSGRWEIVEAAKKMAFKAQNGDLHPEDINDEMFQDELNTRRFPDPELLIRTSGEMRVSNFLLWQIAYTEFYITETLWPDFRKNHLHNAILDYQKRERRFGGIEKKMNSH